MAKHLHEIRDPIHVFVRLSSDERRVVNSSPFQRLRYIHQLALTYLVYPGATHRRFEHSLGVMEVATRIFDIVTEQSNVHARMHDLMPTSDGLRYWRRALRMAALCHDIGHLPFSHAAEDLLPDGWDHERLTIALIESPEMQEIWLTLEDGPLNPAHIVKLAVGQEKLQKFGYDATFSEWEDVLAQIITGDLFGADRIDYLLRDSYHAGVAYGRFDHYRLIDTLRILPGIGEDADRPSLGMEDGGLRSAEALQLARYFMYTQLYFHHVRRIYDRHLRDFLKEWLDGGFFPTDVEKHLQTTDNEILAAISAAARTPGSPGHDPAKRIINREHFRLLFDANRGDKDRHPAPGQAVYEAACLEFGNEQVRHAVLPGKIKQYDFSVLGHDGNIVAARERSDVLSTVPVATYDYVFVARELIAEARKWLDTNRETILQPKEEAN